MYMGKMIRETLYGFVEAGRVESGHMKAERPLAYGPPEPCFITRGSPQRM